MKLTLAAVLVAASLTSPTPAHASGTCPTGHGEWVSSPENGIHNVPSAFLKDGNCQPLNPEVFK